MTSYRCIGESPQMNSCMLGIKIFLYKLGSETGAVEEFNLSTKETRLIHKSDYQINSIVLSKSKKCLALCT